MLYFIPYSCYNLTANCYHLGNRGSSCWCGVHCGHDHNDHCYLGVYHEKEEEKVSLPWQRNRISQHPPVLDNEQNTAFWPSAWIGVYPISKAPPMVWPINTTTCMHSTCPKIMFGYSNEACTSHPVCRPRHRVESKYLICCDQRFMCLQFSQKWVNLIPSGKYCSQCLAINASNASMYGSLHQHWWN